MATDPGELLRQRSLRVTPQRRAILGAFRRGVDEHLSADEVHARAASVVPEIGRGTVYATLAELTELGLLAATGSPEPTRYETNVDPHEHFRCRLCLRTFDVELDAPPQHALRDRGFVVERITVSAEGVCAECGDYRRGLHEGTAALRNAPQLGADVVDALSCTRHETPVGSLVMAASPEGVVRLAFDDHADFDALAARARTRRGSRDSRDRITHALDALDGYFDGALRAADDVVDWPTLGAISPGSLEATRTIPVGEHRSYDRLEVAASAFDRGYAMGSNPVPVLLPCHRVTRGAQALDDYVGGLARRDVLTAFEA